MNKSKNAIGTSNILGAIGRFFFNNKAIAIAIMIAVPLAIMEPLFLTKANILNVLRQVCVNAILAFGLTLVLSSGHIDLSVGSIVGLVGVVVSMCVVWYNIPLPVAILIGVLVGMFCGALNAIMINLFGAPAFIVTLATQSVFRGSIYIVTGMIPVIGLPNEFVEIGQGYVAGIPIPVYIMAGMFLLMLFIVNKTKFGRHALAMGGNSQAAFASGVNIKRTRIITYMILGAYAAIAAVVLTARTASAQTGAGMGMEMDSIAATVIGGTAMSGGHANVLGTIFGCIIVGMINNGLSLVGVDPNWQVIAKGLLILFAVVVDIISTKYINEMRTRSQRH